MGIADGKLRPASDVARNQKGNAPTLDKCNVRSARVIESLETLRIEGELVMLYVVALF